MQARGRVLQRGYQTWQYVLIQEISLYLDCIRVVFACCVIVKV